MAEADFYIAAGTRQPKITATLKDAAGVAVNLTGLSVRFRMRRPGVIAPKVDAPAAIVSAAAGTVEYAWAALDTDTPGLFLYDWLVTFGDGTTAAYPTKGTNTVLIRAAVA